MKDNMTTVNNKPSVFISYSHVDKEWEKKFRPHLKMLEKHSNIVFWDDRMIKPGKEWYEEIKKEMAKAAVSVCFISADYLTSDFVLKEEIPYLLERQKEKGMEIIPVLLRPCLWKAVRWLKKLQMLPGNGESIAVHYKDDCDTPFTSIAERIFEIIDDPNYSMPVFDILFSPPEKINIGRLPETGAKLFGREKELNQLDEAWKSTGTNIISFIAWGGVGKSTLINKWLEYMQADNYKDAERVYAWSFYSQGTNEQVSSADTFISETLKWFGDPDPTSGSAYDKGQRLAGLIRQKKTLLILDGMEPLQSSHKFEKGKIKDQGLAALLRSLALNNNGLCIITSRENVTDISKYKQRVEQLSLEKLSTNAGRALLRVGGVKGSDKELEEAVKAFGNHALAIKLLSVYLQNFNGHHILEAQKIPDLNIPPEKGKHPRRVIEALCKRFTDKAEGGLLKMLGFFDKPADIAAINKIIEPPLINGLTENLCNKGEANLLQAINSLRNESLLAKESKHRPNTLDCHPLIREHFGEKLQNQNPNAWKEAHARLYEYYKNLPEKEFPDKLEEMEPLFAAVMHGCLAGKHQETMDDVYSNRIRRQKEAYTVHKLGAFGADLSCLSNFFESLWDKPASGLRYDFKAGVLNWSGFRLRAIGRLSEAAQPMKAGLEMRIKHKNWEQSALDASNLSELYLTLGDVASAQKYGEQGVNFADRSGNDFHMESKRTTHADAKHQSGKIAETEKLFIEAENMQKKRQAEYPYLYSLQGFQYCDLLLSMGKYKNVLERIRKCFEWRLPSDSLLSISLENLSFGKALMLQAIDKNLLDLSTGLRTSFTEALVLSTSTSLSASLIEAENYLNQAIGGLREAGTQHRLPWGLFARATLSRHQKDFLKSWTDLDEILEIAEYGQMRLHLTDYHLEACRNIKEQLSEEGDRLSVIGDLLSVNSDQLSVFEIIENGETLSLTNNEMKARFQEHFKKAEQLIKETGYHRRDGELEVLRDER